MLIIVQNQKLKKSFKISVIKVLLKKQGFIMSTFCQFGKKSIFKLQVFINKIQGSYIYLQWHKKKVYFEQNIADKIVKAKGWKQRRILCIIFCNMAR